MVTGSLVATGYSPQGTGLMVVAHVPHYLLDPKFLSLQLSRISVGLPELELPEKEFHRLLGMRDDKNVFVVEPDRLYKWPSLGVYGLKKAMEHPLLAPLLGGTARAEKHLARIENALIAYRQKQDLEAEPGIAISYCPTFLSPSARFLAFCGLNILDGNYYLWADGIVVGVPQSLSLPFSTSAVAKAAAE